MEFIRKKEVLKILKVHYQTLYRMEERGEIEVKRTNGGHRLYNLKKYLRENNIKIKSDDKIKVCYCRVSSKKQNKDLEKQIKIMKEKYPDYKIIKDIGSGLNMQRKGLLELIELSINGKIDEIIITYKDRLARFGYDLIKWIVETYSNGKIKIINRKEEETPENEITEDIIQIMNVYVAKMNGKRSKKN